MDELHVRPRHAQRRRLPQSTRVIRGPPRRRMGADDSLLSYPCYLYSRLCCAEEVASDQSSVEAAGNVAIFRGTCVGDHSCWGRGTLANPRRPAKISLTALSALQEIVGPANAPCDMNFVTGMLVSGSGHRCHDTC